MFLIPETLSSRKIIACLKFAAKVADTSHAVYPRPHHSKLWCLLKSLIHPVIYYANIKLNVPGYMLLTIPLQPTRHLLLCHHPRDIAEGFSRQGRGQVTNDHELVLTARWQRVEGSSLQHPL